jgi:SAM-dependent methyltransferase
VLPCSDACERNKGPILEILSGALEAHHLVLEVGAGTGQHAVHFARHLPHLAWQPTERDEYLELLAARVQLEGPPNLRAPLALDVNDEQWPVDTVDVVYSANTLHIMAWHEVEAFLQGVGRVLAPGGLLVVYGPFRFDGRYTSESNAAFDQYLRERDPDSAIRDFEAVDAQAVAMGLRLDANHTMPANNQLLIWRRSR